MRVSVLLALALILVIACQKAQKQDKATDPATTERWKERMAELTLTMAELLPLTFSSTQFGDPANQHKISDLIGNMETLAHKIELTAGEPAYRDPSLQMMAEGFEDELNLAKEAYRAGHTDYARSKLRDTLSYCIQCHTQTSEGAHFMALDLGAQIGSMNLISQAEFFAATRQFSRALEVYKELLSDRSSLSSLEWEKASLHALAIAVRYLRSPEQAMELVNIISADRSTPYYVKKDIQEWKRALAEWQTSWTEEQKLEDEQLLSRAKSILASQAGGELGSAETASAIALLRSSALLHQYLNEPRDKAKTSEALLYLGKAYAGVRQFNLSNLEEGFYELCIKTSPHTPIAKKCYDGYKDKILIGFSGSGGLLIPKDVQRRMKALEKLAAVNK